jgi:hypothetical protein
MEVGANKWIPEHDTKLNHACMHCTIKTSVRAQCNHMRFRLIYRKEMSKYAIVPAKNELMDEDKV